MRLDDSKKISLEYILAYILATIYKISLNDEDIYSFQNRNVVSISE